jgi:hypothetical protein
MRLPVLFMLALVIAPTIGNARISFDSLKEGAARAASAVGETTDSAVDAAGEVAGKASGALKESVDYSTESLGDEATPEATRGKLDAMATRTLVRLFAERPDSRDLFDRSAGYAVFDKREASFYLVAGYGRGVAVDAASDARVYMKMATTGGSLSFGLGGFASHVVILFENSAELDKFIARGLDAAAEVGTMAGERKDQFALRFNEGKAVFLLTNSGWKVEAKLTGSRYWPDKALNPQAN